MKIDDKVIVNIKHYTDYALGCAECLDKQTGKIIKVQHDLFDMELKFLVEFDVPVKSWLENAPDIEAFWFEEDNLKVKK